MKARIFAFLTVFVIALSGIGYAFADSQSCKDIGVAWRGVDAESYVYTLRSIEAAGGNVLEMDQVICYDLEYDSQGNLISGVDENGILTEEAADTVKNGSWRNSNVAEVVGDLTTIVFTGGEDICPSLYKDPQEWHGIEEDKAYNAKRDVSDFLLMSYCLDNDINVLAICRGMQMLSVVSGASMIQDLGQYFDDMGIEYHHEHRNQAPYTGGYRDYAPHEVLIEEDSLLYKTAGASILYGCPSWHHQAVKSVEDTNLVVTAYTITEGVPIIEAVERTDKTFIIGIQYHPEAAVCKHLDHMDNEDDFMDYRSALSVFDYIVNKLD